MIKKTFRPDEAEKAQKFVKDFIQHCGNLMSFYHFRNSIEEHFETIIVGDKGVLVLVDGLRSGNQGKGAASLIEVLEFLGLSKQEASALVLDNNEEEYYLKYYFK